MRRPPIPTPLVPLGALAPIAALVLLLAAGGALADTTATPQTTEVSPTATGTTTVPAPPPPEAAPPTTTSTTTTSTTTATTQTTTVPAPEALAQRQQRRTVARSHGKSATSAPASSTTRNAKTGAAGNTNGLAVSPSALTPPLPSTLGGSISGVPSFFIDSFSIPPFLLPIYQAAGAAYGLPWQVLAAINEVETDYGRDLSVSSAGAEGWMQFMPSTWAQYGVDVNKDGFQDPYNPADAIFAAARYLKVAGGDTDIRSAIFAYNHSQAYVNSVMLRARLLGGTPPQLLGAITGLTESRFPVYAAAHYSDGFPSTEGAFPRVVPGTTIYTQAGAPAIAVQDGRVTRIARSGPLGPSISLRDAYGNTYTYAGLGTLSALYPVLETVESESKGTARPRGALSGFAPGASAANPASSGATRVFRAGSDNVYLHTLHVGAQVIAGTVLGRVAPGSQPHMVFQI
ncbi:MAG TPA: lytic murein transglycosylase, partial [Solirubrobacteraceae bacterium]